MDGAATQVCFSCFSCFSFSLFQFLISVFSFEIEYSSPPILS